MWDPKDFESQRPILDEGCFPPYIDDRHARILYESLMTGRFKNVLEIGCWNGFSTSAILRAQEDGAQFNLTLCDVEIRPRLSVLVNWFVARGVPRPHIAHARSKDIINPEFDLIFVDGDHRLETVAEELALILESKTRSIFAHDVSGCVPWFDGSAHLMRILQAVDGYSFLDNKKRKGEWTERGFFFWTKDVEIWDAVGDVWSRHTS